MNRVRFDDNVTVYVCPMENRKAPWMLLARNRRHFERRIRQTELILHSVLIAKRMEQSRRRFYELFI
jgi:hypothetical protein